MNINSNLHRKFKQGICLVLAAMFMVSASARAESDCEKGTLEGSAVLQTVMGPGTGYAFMTLGDQTIPISSFGVFVPPMKVTEDGTIHLTIEENDTTPDGSTLKFLDSLVLSPTDLPGEYRLLIKSVFVEGTGIFDDPDLAGRYVGHGEVSFNTLTLSHSGMVTVCGFGS